MYIIRKIILETINLGFAQIVLDLDESKRLKVTMTEPYVQ